MKLERVALVTVAAALALAGLGAVFPVGGPAWRLLELVVWAATGLFAATAVLWTALTYVVGAGYEPPDPVHGPGDV